MGGLEWIVDAFGCDGARLSDVDAVRGALDEIVERLSLRVIDAPHYHRFGAPHGVTGLYLLSESHLAVHTFPESGFASLNLYCCRPRAELDFRALLAERFGATRVLVRTISRGVEQP